MPARLAPLLDGDNGSLSSTLGIGDPIEQQQRFNGNAFLLGRQASQQPIFGKASPSALPLVPNVDYNGHDSAGDGGGSGGGTGDGDGNGGDNGSAGGDSGDGSGDGGEGGVA